MAAYVPMGKPAVQTLLADCVMVRRIQEIKASFEYLYTFRNDFIQVPWIALINRFFILAISTDQGTIVGGNYL